MVALGSGRDSEESPCRRYAFEFVLAAVVERRARTCDEIDDGWGHEDLAGFRSFADAACEVDGDARELGTASFDFTGVDPDANVEADLAGRVADRGPTTDDGAGPSKVASIPSPVSFSSWPEKRVSCRLTASSRRSRTNARLGHQRWRCGRWSRQRR
jgi:hypothetical protein